MDSEKFLVFRVTLAIEMGEEDPGEKQKAFVKDYLKMIRAALYFSALYHVHKEGW